MVFRLLKTLAGSLCLAALLCVSSADAAKREFLVITDLHFNPFHGLNADEFATLSQMPATQWRSFFDGLKQPMVPLGADGNYCLLASALTEAATRLEDPEFILFGGDFLAHDWQSSYNALADEPIAANPQAYRDFTAKAIQFIAGEFRERFPDAVVLPTLGNDDSFCQDYWIQANGAFLKQFAGIWRPMLGATVDAAAFDRSFSSLGCYAADLPGLENHRLIVLNSVLWSKSYCSAYHDPGGKNCCGCTNPGDAPGAAALAWLDQALSRAKSDKKTVWLLMHVPPGLDSYEEEEADGKSAAASLWKEAFLDRYLELVGTYRSILLISFAGHTHMDDYRVAQIDGEAAVLCKVVPSVSPVFGNNPAFQVYQFEEDTGALAGWQTYSLGLATSGGPSATPTWRREYDSLEAYRLTAIDAETAAALFARIRDNPAGREAEGYRRFFRAGAKPISAAHLPIYVCAVLNPLYAGYSACVSGRHLPVPREMENPARLRRRAGGLGEPKP
jgi:hypothetical protein